MRGAAMLREQEPAPQRAGQGKPRVCFVSPYIWPVLSRDRGVKIVGGAEVQQSIIARLLRRRGYPVSVVCNDHGQPDRAEVDGIVAHKTFRDSEGIPVLRFVHPRLTSVWRALKQADADIYYQRSADMLTGVVAEFCRRYGRHSVFAGASDNDFDRGRQQIRFARDRWIFEHGLARVDRVVVQNRAQLAACKAQYGRDATLIPSCYELPASAEYGADKAERVLWVATIHPYKRPDLALEVARLLPHRRFVMIGGASSRGTRYSPEYYEGIEEAAARLPNVEFKGFLPLAEVETWFDRARVFLNTSIHEGVPNTFMQAWARGIPTVATVHIEEMDVYQTVADAQGAAEEVERLFEDRLHWARASARCREYFHQSHSPEETLARYERLFEELAPAR